MSPLSMFAGVFAVLASQRAGTEGGHYLPCINVRFFWLLLALGLVPRASLGADRIVGMYVHQHWPYNHPYSARTWTLADWRGYAGGLKKLGYNTVMIWPVLETMPNPLTPSDRAHLELTSKVIDMLHENLGMRAWIVLCPNVAARDDEARKAPFEKRHFFYTDMRVNPADRTAVRRMIDWRQELLRPLAKADAVSIIDSDPGGYPGSTNAEFINLLGEHRKMLDRLRPGIELDYWIHAGWPAYSRFYLTGHFAMGVEPEYLEALRLLQKLNPEPWGLANGLKYAEKLGLGSRVVALNYGRIEGEPTFPMTNFTPADAVQAGSAPAPRGVMGNAQTHCVQLPNTFAFARGASGGTVRETDLVQFAGELIPGRGEVIVRAWKAVGGTDPAEMRSAAAVLGKLPADLRAGDLRGLLFDDPHRFITDLIMELRVKAAAEDLYATADAGLDVRPALKSFLDAAEVWQRQHGYENHWSWPKLNAALKKLNSAAINEVLEPSLKSTAGFERVQEHYRLTETYTPRLLAAMKQALQNMSGSQWR